jgi:putative membrane protein
MAISKYFQGKHRENLLIGILIIFYSVGTVGILIPTFTHQFLALSFFNLVLSTAVVLLARKKDFLNFLFFLGLCFLTGMTAEWIGTKTGWLFGNYWYGKNLGPKIDGVPYVIGLNWGILVVSSASVINRIKASVLVKSILAALLMTALDYLMEPVAISSDFWHWKGEIPIYNYVCWFAISLPLHYIYFRWNIVETNKVFTSLFMILTIFFIILNLF